MTQHLVVTGGICSGKSSIMKHLAEYYPQQQFSFDEYTKELYQLPRVQSFLMTFFGTADKSEISNIVFKSPHRLAMLNEFFLPLVVDKFKELIQSDIPTIIEFPMFFQVCHISSEVRGIYGGADCKVLEVYCSQLVRRNRIIERDDVSPEKAENIIKSQRNDATTKLLSHYLIDTSYDVPNHVYITHMMKEVFNEQ